jgi:hydroxypyruvate isomerase
MLFTKVDFRDRFEAPFPFDLLDRIGYPGWIGCEYIPRGATADGLGWLRPYLDRTTAVS